MDHFAHRVKEGKVDLASGDDIEVPGKNVHEFPLALVAPLRAEHRRDLAERRDPVDGTDLLHSRQGRGRHQDPGGGPPRAP